MPRVIAFLALLFLAGLTATAASQEPASRAAPQVNSKTLAGKHFRFSWKSGERGGLNGIATLRKDGRILGIHCPNETFWMVDDRGRLVFKHQDGRISSVFDKIEIRNGRYHFKGLFTFRKNILHFLEETTAPRPPHCILPEDAARIVCSSQRFVYLDIGEETVFTLASGKKKTIRLTAVEDHRDPVVNLVRRADVRVEVDGKPLDLVCAPYVLPTEVDGLRIQADTTTGWLPIPKRVQLSLWVASKPVVDTARFRFPLRNYRLFSHGLQAYNEPVHIGHKDGDPAGGRFYHNYGVDLAGYEGREEVVCCTGGVVLRLWPERDPSSIAVADDRGIVWEYGHLDVMASDVKPGAPVRQGQTLGYLGRKGGSGNFSHLHLGVFLTRDDAMVVRNTRNLNLYPWLVEAWRHQFGPTLMAVARPHHTTRTGDTVHFDGSYSLAGPSQIVDHCWRFHDGETVKGVRATKIYKKPGTYMATLRVRDAAGREDVDFCKVKVFTRDRPEPVTPILFVTYTPTRSIRVNTPVNFRGWVQGSGQRPFSLDFGDSTRVEKYEPCSEITHRFKKPGLHVVTATARIEGLPVTQKIKVVVDP